MPPRRPPVARPQTAFCRYDVDRRCRRIATVDGQLCREHAILLQTQIQPGSGLADLIGALDREISRTAAKDPVVGAFAKIVGDLFRPRAPRPGSLPQQPPPRQPPRPPPSSPPDQSAAARIVLGFEPNETLTKDMIDKRKKALARVFHPDMQGGSEAHMKRINQAADVLLAKLA